MGEDEIKGMLCISFAIFILCAFIFPALASAQCDDCDDKNPCTRDYCNGTQCLHEPTTCSDIHQPEKISFPRDGAIVRDEIAGNSNLSAKASFGMSPSIHEPVSCDDNDPCTADYYSARGCVHMPINCEKNNTDISGTMKFPNAGTSPETPVNCDDNNICTEDSWDGRTCIHTQISCDDGNASTVDSCGSTGCIYTPLNNDNTKAGTIESCKTCLSEVQVNSGDAGAADHGSLNNGSNNENASEYTDCSDGDPCTADAYDGTRCIHSPKNCDDGNASTLDSCAAGVCINEPIKRIEGMNSSIELTSVKQSMQLPNCDDGDPCTNDTYKGIGCEHVQKSCDDGNASTFDYCYEGACVNTQKSCDDGNPCTIDSYNGTECVYKPMNCDDANACTIDSCSSGVCKHKPKVCSDGNPCTTDSCDPAKGCISTFKSCDDGNACTVDACDGYGNCVHMLRNCDDGNPCTIDQCDPYWGCVHAPVACRAGETCVNGACQAISNAGAAPGSYIIPAGSSIVLPWKASVTAIGPARVENGVAYPPGQPLEFSRQLGYYQETPVAYGMSQITPGAEMVGLSWQGNPFNVTLIKPDGSALSPDNDPQSIKHVTGANYDYYFIRNPAKGEWNVNIWPVSPAIGGEAFSLITGFVAGA